MYERSRGLKNRIAKRLTTWLWSLKKEMIILYLVDNLKEGDERVLDEDEDEEVRLPLLTQDEISKISLTTVEPNVRLTCMHVQVYRLQVCP